MKKIMFLLLALSVMAMGDAAANVRKPNNGRGPNKVKIELNLNCDGHHHGFGSDYRWNGHRDKSCKACDRHFKAHGPKSKHRVCPACDRRAPRPAPRPGYGPRYNGCGPRPNFGPGYYR